MTLEGVFPSTEQAQRLRDHGWSLVSTSSVMGALKGETGLMVRWDEALRMVEAEQAEARKAKR